MTKLGRFAKQNVIKTLVTSCMDLCFKSAPAYSYRQKYLIFKLGSNGTSLGHF